MAKKALTRGLTHEPSHREVRKLIKSLRQLSQAR